MQNGIMPQHPQVQTQPTPQQMPAQPGMVQVSGQIPGQGRPQTQINAQDFQIALLQRVAMLGEDDLEILDSIINPETIKMWETLFPELKILFMEASAFKDMTGEQNQEEQEPEKDVKMMDDQNPLVSDGLMR